ncbi:MAG: response regulator [bacterium]|jgi:putative two-component system response regulator
MINEAGKFDSRIEPRVRIPPAASQEYASSGRVLIVDDEAPVVRTIERILRACGLSEIATTTDSRKAAVLYNEFRPDAVLLDINMPNMDGFAVLAQLKRLENDDPVPVLILTASEDSDTRIRALSEGALDFIAKPFDHLELQVRVRNLLSIRQANRKLREMLDHLEARVMEQTEHIRQSQLEIVHRLGRAAEYKDEQTGVHILRMSWYASKMFEALGRAPADCHLILHAAPMHDIGKIGIPDVILKKPGKLDAAEWEVMKRHTTIGAELLSRGKSEVLQLAEVIALTHHEKWDGTGYPAGLRGEAIPLEGRVTAICDVFDALTSERPYKRAWPMDEALEEIRRLSGTHFEPAVVDVFFEVLPDLLNVRELFD